MKTKSILLFFISFFLVSLAMSQRCVNFSGLPIGTQFGTPVNSNGDLIFTEAGISVYTMDFYHDPTHTWFGHGVIENDSLCGMGHIPFLNNLNLYFDFDSLVNGPAEEVTFYYRSLGGFENLGVNTTFPCFIDELINYTNQCPGYTVNIIPTGTVCKRVIVTGHLTGILLGGQEFYLDSVCAYFPLGIDRKDPGSQLGTNYPNPFYHVTRIPFKIASSGTVNIKIFNSSGVHIRTLTDSFYPEGSHEIEWDGTNHLGQQQHTGIYFYRLQTREKVYIKKMSLIR